MNTTQLRRRIVHVVYSFSAGGLENVIVQLINRLPADQFEHVVMALTTISDFKNRITQPGVRFIELEKQPGHAVPLYPRIYKLLREIKPDVVHTCNLAALEVTPLAWLARVPLRIHAEHGWDSHDPKGMSKKYRRVRKLYRPFVSHYVAVSKDLFRYLADGVGIPQCRRTLIANGVDTDAFRPADAMGVGLSGCPFSAAEHWIIGTVGRMQTVKNQPMLARVFVRLINEHPEARYRMRLVMVGDGPLKKEVEQILTRGGLQDLAWLPGTRSDVADVLNQLRCFVLPSQAEGTSCTLQEAMSCRLPVVATAVGGTPEVVQHGRNGQLVPADDEAAMAEAIWTVFLDESMALAQGFAARKTVVDHFGLQAMVDQYSPIFLGSLAA
ncbi:sugar transferase [Rhodococcus sp. SRB_17]|nr:sugar transferase [Rhodococcus sp. SRB_17]